MEHRCGRPASNVSTPDRMRFSWNPSIESPTTAWAQAANVRTLMAFLPFVVETTNSCIVCDVNPPQPNKLFEALAAIRRCSVRAASSLPERTFRTPAVRPWRTVACRRDRTAARTCPIACAVAPSGQTVSTTFPACPASSRYSCAEATSDKAKLRSMRTLNVPSVSPL